MPRKESNIDMHKLAMRRAAWFEKVEAMRDGRRQRSATFSTPKGPGSYKRKPKYGNNNEER